MLRTLERTIKYLAAALLRFVVGSHPASLSSVSTFDRILVIRQHNQLGDMLCVVPLLRALRERFPAAYIVLMTSPVNYDIMLNNRYLNKVINLDKKEFLGKGLAGWRRFFLFTRTLKDEKFDIVLVPSTVSTSFTSDFLAYISGARMRIGASSLDGNTNPSSFLYTNPIELDWRSLPNRHQTLRNLDVGKQLDLKCSDLSLEITFDKDELRFINNLKNNKLTAGKSIISYHPGAGKGPNRWSAPRFADVANRISQELGASVLITSGPMDDGPVSEMVSCLKVPYSILADKPIREVAAVLSTVSLVVTNDTGIMHVAAAVGVPVLSLFGPTDAEQWAPPGKNNRFLRGKGGDVNAITVEEVSKNITEMLSIVSCSG